MLSAKFFKICTRRDWANLNLHTCTTGATHNVRPNLALTMHFSSLIQALKRHQY